DDGADALQKVAQCQPDIVILDVEMPQMNGYEVCQRLRENEAYQELPILFLSGKDAIEDRLKGLEVGGDDYLTKPFNLLFLEAKVKALLTLAEQRRQLRESVSFTSAAAMTAMSSMSELGCLLEGVKTFNHCDDFAALAQAIVNTAGNFGLDCVVQLRSASGVFSLTSRGPASPLDLSVIEHMSKMERITQFKNRLAITYEQVSLLVNNLPLEDADRCGRLRDHLAMLLESAQARVVALDMMQAAQHRGEVIRQVVQRISKTLEMIDQAQREGRAATALAVNQANMEAERALLSVALSDQQERYMANVFRTGLERVVDVQSKEVLVQDQLSSIINELRAVQGSA
ncbi:response regulator transcription factor, partial [Chitinimonas sp.]|uniref:response regulator transcription factor n=1 Tax=Chitinimonas sp. TaxID=1934313 RepID=UPI0035B3B030